MLDFTRGCGKVNCPSGQEKVPWGATSRRTAGKFICTRATAGECSRTVANRAQTNDFAAA